MGKVVDFNAARNEKEHGRKEARIEELKKSFKTARESGESKPKSVEKLKKLFRNTSPKKNK